MTPEQYVELEKTKRDEIASIEAALTKARARAAKSPLPKNLRPATASDIVEWQIIWHVDPNDKTDYYWHVVEEVLCPDDDWKAYSADDGCRYGLFQAHVRDK